MVAKLWPVSGASQADYEALRRAALSEKPLDGCCARIFARRGLAGLITSPSSDPRFDAILVGARRPTWSPYEDPRLATLAEAYGLLLGDHPRIPLEEEIAH